MPKDEEEIRKHLEYFDKRVKLIESDHREMSQAFRDFKKDFHVLVDTFGEVKEMLKAMYKTSQGIALFEQRYDFNREHDKHAIKRLHDRIDKVKEEFQDDLNAANKILTKDVGEVKANISRVVWLVLSAVIVALLTQIFK